MTQSTRDMKTEIMDAAERRIQNGGFGGFSFREIAADVGIKSSSVHYHFPTKEDLVAAVVRRWSQFTVSVVDAAFADHPDPIEVWTRAFSGVVHTPPHMCPVTVLGASARDLPEQVAREVKAFFALCHEKLVAQGLEPGQASEFLSTLVGAVVLANALQDEAAYDRAVKALPRRPVAA